MYKILAVVICLFPCLLKAQENKGILFTKGLTWNQVKEKAKLEHKDIFIDAYATWCGPCKRMDKEIYTDQQIGDKVNEKYISVKIQMDSTLEDLPDIMQWYADASVIQRKYKIAAFPSFLFLSHDEKLIDRDLGFKTKDEFIKLVSKASNLNESYAANVSQFQAGTLSVDKLLGFALEAKKNGDDSLALTTAKSYKIRIVDIKPSDSLVSPELPEALAKFTAIFNVNDGIIHYLFKNAQKTDSAMAIWKGFSTAYVQYFISRDIIFNKILPNNVAISTEPNWSELEAEISNQFDGVIAKRVIINAQVYWYTVKPDWPKAIKYNIEKIEFNGVDTSGMGADEVNGMVYNILFKHSTKKSELKKGINYMEILLKADPNNYHKIDTYSNILYKAGYKDLAIKQELKALNLAKKDNQKNSVKLYEETLNKMRENRPTWPEVK